MKWCNRCVKLYGSFLKLNEERPYDLAILLVGVYPKGLEAETQTYICTPVFTAALFTIAKKGKQPKCPSVDDG